MARPNPMPQAPSPSAQAPARSGHGGSFQQPLLAMFNVILIISLCYFLRRILCRKGTFTNSSGDLDATVVGSPITEPTKTEAFGRDAAHDILSSLATFVHSAVAADGSDGEKCTVCLTEFAEGEVGRLFPACHHMFHPECISMWLTSHSSCPNCRSTIEVDKIYPPFVLSLSSH